MEEVWLVVVSVVGGAYGDAGRGTRAGGGGGATGRHGVGCSLNPTLLVFKGAEMKLGGPEEQTNSFDMTQWGGHRQRAWLALNSTHTMQL